MYNRILQTLSFPQRNPAHNQYDEKELSNCYITTMIMMQLKCNGDGDDGGDNYIGEGLRRSGSEHVPNPCLAALLQWRSMFRMVLIMRPCWLDSSVTLCDEDEYMLYSR